MAKTPDNEPTPPVPPAERIRPGEFAERELWHLDEDEHGSAKAGKDAPPQENPPPPTAAETAASDYLPSPADWKKPKAKPTTLSSQQTKARPPLTGFSGKQTRTPATLSNRLRSHPHDSTFSDLDETLPAKQSAKAQWHEETPADDSPEAPPPAATAAATPPPPDASAQPENPLPPETPAPSESLSQAVETPAQPTTQTPVQTTAQHTARPRVRLSLVEKLALAAIAVLLIGAATWLLRSFQKNIPTSPSAVDKITFPVKGQYSSIIDAATFWREPRRGGPAADSARAEARLIPVLKLKIQGPGQGALRVFFRNELGDPIGDSITRPFSNGRFTANDSPEIEIPATAGFDDEGMYAAYRASRTTPWRIHIYEGPDAKASFQEFRKLLEVPISTTRQ